MALVALASLGMEEAPEYPDDPSAFTTVIDATAYDDRFETVADLLDHVAGVRVRRYGGLGAFSTASIRGAKSERVLVLLDGVRLNSAYRGDVDLSTLPLRLVERIDVVRGGGAARYGSEAIGGVISIRTRSEASVPGVDGSATAGDHRTLGADALFSARRGPASAVLAYNRLRSRSDFRFDREAPGGTFPGLAIPERRHTRLGADFLEETGLVKLGLETSPQRRVEATVHLHRTDRGQPGSTRAAPTGARDDPGPSDDKVSCPYASERFRRGVFRVSWTDGAFGPGSFEGALFHRFERSRLHDPEGICRLIVPAIRQGRDTVENTDWESGLELRYAGRPVRLGPFVLRGRTATTLRAEGWRGDEADDTGRWIGTFFLQEDISLFEGRLRLIPAVGFEDVWTRETRVRDPGTGAPIDVRPDEGAEWLPRIGAILRVAPGVRLKSNYGRGYRRPTFQELFLPDQGFVRGNPNLVPEESLGFDLGIEARRAKVAFLADLHFEAVYFHRDLDDPIEFLQVNAFTFAPRNLSSSRVRGVEIQGSVTAHRRLELSLAYTHLDAEIRNSGAPLPHRPRNRLFLQAALRLGAARVWADLIREDEVPLNETGTIFAEAASQLDIGVSLRPARVPGLGWLPEGLALSLEWVNVTDEQRVDSLGLPLPGRLWYVRVRAARP